jgi:hypothetical protein
MCEGEAAEWVGPLRALTAKAEGLDTGAEVSEIKDTWALASLAVMLAEISM